MTMNKKLTERLNKINEPVLKKQKIHRVREDRLYYIYSKSEILQLKRKIFNLNKHGVSNHAYFQ